MKWNKLKYLTQFPIDSKNLPKKSHFLKEIEEKAQKKEITTKKSPNFFKRFNETPKKTQFIRDLKRPPNNHSIYKRFKEPPNLNFLKDSMKPPKKSLNFQISIFERWSIFTWSHYILNSVQNLNSWRFQ